MSDERESSREGWDPGALSGARLAEVIEHAFDYRGDVTLVLDDGSQLDGYLFNRDREVPDPFVQIYERSQGGASTIPYARIRAIRFTGKDTAAGNSYAAWRERREAARAASEH